MHPQLLSHSPGPGWGRSHIIYRKAQGSRRRLVSHQHLHHFLFQLTLSKVTQLLPNWTLSPQHLTPFLLERQKINALPHAISACLAVPERLAVREAVWCLALPGFYSALPWDIISQGAGGTGVVVLPAQRSTDLARAGQVPPTHAPTQRRWGQVLRLEDYGQKGLVAEGAAPSQASRQGMGATGPCKGTPLAGSRERVPIPAASVLLSGTSLPPRALEVGWCLTAS